MSGVPEMVSKKSYRDSLAALHAPASNPRDPDWLREIREKAFRRFREMGLPSRRLEAWRTMNLERLLNTPLVAAHGDRAEPSSFDLKEIFGEEEKNGLLFANETFLKAWSSAPDRANGMILCDLRSAEKQWSEKIIPLLSQAAESEANAFSLVNLFSFTNGIFLYLPAGMVLQAPIHLVITGAGHPEAPPVFYPRILAIFEKGAKADLVLHHAGAGKGPYFMNAAAEVLLGEGAKINWVNVQRDAAEGYQFLTTRCRLSRGSHLEMTDFVEEAGVARHETNVFLNGENSFCSLRGLLLLVGDSQVFYHAGVEHQAPSATSRQTVKTILGGRAQSEFDSLVHVARDAQRSDSSQLNRNLLLSDSARAYSKPRFLIDADDVQCTHGSATGRLEKDELFYLRSRGLTKELARFVLIYGFAEEIVESIVPAGLRRLLEESVRAKLKQMVEGSPC